MLLPALSFLVVAQSSSEVPEGLMNNPVFKEELNIALTSPLLKMVSYDSLLNLLTKSDIVHIVIFLIVLEFSIGMWE